MGALERFLLPDSPHRERMLDMDRRLGPVRRFTVALLVVGLLIAAPWIGWTAVLPLVIGLALFSNGDLIAERVQRPERVVTLFWIGLQAMIALSALVAGAPEEPALPLLAILVLSLSARVSTRGIVLGVGYTLVLMVAVAFAGNADAVVADPALLLLPMILVLAIGTLSTVMMRSDVEHREEAVVDPLTSMLNRKALANRVAELRQQAAHVAAPVAIVMIDIDHFKAVNDSAGHLVGDTVLREVAEIIRGDLRAYELAYRMGGEEFLVLLPSADRTQGLAVADRLRTCVENATFTEGVEVTVSCGVAATAGGKLFDFEALLSSADRSLYAAKRAGRNRALSLPTTEFEVIAA